MKTLELKNKLIDQIKASKDTGFLEQLYNYLAHENKSREIYQLSELQNSAVEEARTQYKRSEYETDGQTNKEIEKWLKK